MEKIFEARTEQEAIELAAQEFGVSSEYIDIEVIKRNKSGIFGLQNKITIRANVAGLPQTDKHENDADIDMQIQAKNTAVFEEGSENFFLTDDIKQAITTFIDTIAQYLQIEIKAVRMDDGQYVNIDVKRIEDQNLLIGKFGKNIEALQILINAMLQNTIRDISGWIVVDVAGYRKKRTAWLREIAVKKAHQVLQTGKSYLMDDFSPYDRRQIHFAIKTIEGVDTESEGNGYFKRVRIFLA